MNDTKHRAVRLSQEDLETILRLVGHALRDKQISPPGRLRIKSIGEKALKSLFELGE